MGSLSDSCVIGKVGNGYQTRSDRLEVVGIRRSDAFRGLIDITLCQSRGVLTRHANNEGIIPGMREVRRLWQAEGYFLPQVNLAA